MGLLTLTRHSSIALSRKVIGLNLRNKSSLAKQLQDELKEFPSVITLPLQWGQQDANNHLNNVDWLRFIESGRIDYIYLLSSSMSKEEAELLLRGTGESFVVKSQECNYKVPITYPDTITIATRIENLSPDRFVFFAKMYSNHLSKLASESKVLCVSYNHAKKTKSLFTDGFVEAVKKLEANPVLAQEKALGLPFRKFIRSLEFKKRCE